MSEIFSKKLIDLSEEDRKLIFEAAIKLRSGELTGEIMAMGQFGYSSSGWGHCFETACDMFKCIVFNKIE